MILSTRALWLLGLALVVLLVALVTPWLAWVAAVLDLALLVGCLWDAHAAGRIPVVVTRTLPDVLYQGSTAEVHLTLSGRARVRVRDPLAAEISVAAVVFDAAAPAIHAVSVAPALRGEVTLGAVTGLVLGPLGLVWRGRRWVEPCRVRVLPRVHFEGEDGLFLRGQLQSRASVRVDRRRGQTGELHALREYVAGDDVRRIHWSATARMRRPIVSELEWERHQQVVLLLDAGRAMGAMAGTAPKLDRALAALLALLRVAVVNDDRVTVVLFSQTVRKVVVVAQGRSWPAVFDALYAEHADGLPSDYLGVAAWVAARVRRRSLVALFTSVGDPAGVESLAPAMMALRRHHHAVLVDLEDPAVVEAVRAPPRDEAALCSMASAWSVRARNEALATRLRRGGVDVVRAEADAVMVRTVQRYLEIRARGGVG